MGGRQMSDPDAAPRTDSDVNADDVFDVLSNARRRSVITYLHDADDVVELTELVDWIRTREPDRSEEDHREAVAIALHHVHLPKLAASGVIDYDPRSRTIRYREPPELDQQVALPEEVVGDLT